MILGRLRHRITFLTLETSQNGYGESVQNWVDGATVWASKEPLLGNEYFAAEAVQSKVEVKFRTHFRPDVDNAMRVQHGEDIYDILSAVDVDGRSRELLIYARKRVV